MSNYEFHFLSIVVLKKISSCLSPLEYLLVYNGVKYLSGGYSQTSIHQVSNCVHNILKVCKGVMMFKKASNSNIILNIYFSKIYQVFVGVSGAKKNIYWCSLF